MVKAKDNDKNRPHYGAGLASSLKSNNENENIDFNRVALSLSLFIAKANSSVQEAFKKSVLNYDNWEN